MNDEMILKAIDTPFESDDFDTPITLRKWFFLVLTEIYDKEESFSGKRPFGNSGWIYYEDGYPEDLESAHTVSVKVGVAQRKPAADFLDSEQETPERWSASTQPSAILRGGWSKSANLLRESEA